MGKNNRRRPSLDRMNRKAYLSKLKSSGALKDEWEFGMKKRNSVSDRTACAKALR